MVGKAVPLPVWLPRLLPLGAKGVVVALVDKERGALGVLLRVPQPPTEEEGSAVELSEEEVVKVSLPVAEGHNDGSPESVPPAEAHSVAELAAETLAAPSVPLLDELGAPLAEGVPLPVGAPPVLPVPPHTVLLRAPLSDCKGLHEVEGQFDAELEGLGVDDEKSEVVPAPLSEGEPLDEPVPVTDALILALLLLLPELEAQPLLLPPPAAVPVPSPRTVPLSLAVAVTSAVADNDPEAQPEGELLRDAEPESVALRVEGAEAEAHKEAAPVIVPLILAPTLPVPPCPLREAAADALPLPVIELLALLLADALLLPLVHADAEGGAEALPEGWLLALPLRVAPLPQLAEAPLLPESELEAEGLSA